MGELDDVMRTTFAGRTFTDEDVTDDEIASILDAARFAPSGGNRQGWRVVVVRDPATKAAVVEAGVPAIRRYLAQRLAGENPWNTVVASAVTDEDVAAIGDDHIAWYRGLADAPVLLVVGVDLAVVASVDAELDRVGVASGASIYPFVHNILLAARARGLTGALTTFASADEAQVKATLRLPDEVAVAAVVPIGHPTEVLTKLSRNPVESFARLGTWDGPPLAAPDPG
ncbi:MAG: nitroreductase family protein [Actinomycetota bacterium]|nr:nitroreductase family protein [Actinomycetota bacterium]